MLLSRAYVHVYLVVANPPIPYLFASSTIRFVVGRTFSSDWGWGVFFNIVPITSCKAYGASTD
eukprot:1193381-Amphidinium_carterae.1